MKKKILIAVYFLLFVAMIVLWRTSYVNSLCGFYNICEWGIYVFIVPAVYLFFALIDKTSKSFLILCAITLGVVIPILLTIDWSSGYIIHKLSATLSGSLIAYLITK